MAAVPNRTSSSHPPTRHKGASWAREMDSMSNSADICPSSTIARSFSAELEDIFRIEDSVADLDAKLDERCVTQRAI